MKQFLLPLLLIVSILDISPNASAESRLTDYALMTATPYRSEVALGKERLEKFLSKANEKKKALLAQYPVVAVQAAMLKASEAAPILRRLQWGSIGGGSNDTMDRASTPVQFLLLFDSRTQQLISDDGFLVISTPSRGKPGLFGGNTAIYIGTGW
jgi:hypothetical protein